ncbi:MAG: helicase-exonuclease AddAB subunit AddB [Caldicoprobacterales bacterium]|jgi:ATP-dependent helicase/nuclease subunit B
MSLRIIYGRAGCGKSHFCMQEIRNRLEDKKADQVKGPLILLVPEQYSMQAEKDLVQIAPRGGAIDAQVLSFRRMAYRVFAEVGGFTRRHINPSGKAMLLYRIIEELREHLNFFHRASAQSGFVNTISELISELKRYNITPDMLENLHTSIEDETLKEKIKEIGIIYRRFEELVHQRYIDADDDLTLLAEKLAESTQFDGAEIWIDEFSGFTPQEYRVIEELLKKGKRISVCLCTDYLMDEMPFLNNDVFAPVRNTTARLLELARKNDIEIEKPVTFKEQPYYRYKDSEELAHLEGYFFSYPYKRYTEKTSDIEIFTASNIYTEIEQAARKIQCLCRERGIRYKDIAVVTRNLDEYHKLISAIFSQYGIPFFIDMKKPIDSHPLVTLILSMMDIFIHNWSYEAVFRYLKTGLTGINREDIDILENYVLANGIRGNQWLREDDWNFRPDSEFSTTGITERELYILDRVNKTRREILKPIMDFRNKTRGRTSVRIMCSAVYEFLCDLKVPELIEDRIHTLEDGGSLTLANEYSQIWNIVMEVLDQTVEAMGEESMGIEKFRNVLAIGFSEHKIGLIPPSLDQVLVGSIERSRSHEIKALLILGVNDGVFPAPPGEEGLLSDSDRQALRAMGVELAQDTRTQAFEEQFIIYSTLSTTGGLLYISYPIADHEGRTMRPSIIISRLRKIFPNITESNNLVEGDNPGDILDMVCAPMPTFNELIAILRQGVLGHKINPVWKHVRDWYEKQELWKERLDRVQEWIGYTNQVEKIDVNRAKQLYGSPVYSSISRLEQYASCPFSFYLRYGLGARDRKVFKLTPPDLGSFMHHVIDEFSNRIKEVGMSWRELDRDWCEKEISSIVDELLEKRMGWLVNNSPRYRYLVVRLKRIITRAIWVIAEHISRSSFEPIGYEVSFGESRKDKFPPIVLELPSGEKIHLVGRIDRVDALKTHEGTYIRIIDYKSGRRDFKLSDVYYGLQIQLVTYLGAVLEHGQEALKDKVLPGGMLYFRIDDPMIRLTGEVDDKEIEKAIMKELRMKGLVLADVKLIREMDKDIDGSSLVIPARINKDGNLGKSSAATMEQFDELCRFSKKLLTEMAREMMEGRIPIRPYREKKVTACDYCPYSPVCQFDPSFQDNRYRLIRDMKDEEVWNVIRKGGLEDEQ